MSGPKQLFDAAAKAYEDGDIEEAQRLGKKIVDEYPGYRLPSVAKEFVQTSKAPSTSVMAGQKAQRNAARSSEVTQSSGRYATTRMLATIFEFIGWAVVVVGVVVAIALSDRLGPVGLLSGSGVSFFGLLQVMGGQLIRAQVDTSDTALEILQVLKSRDQ